MDPQDAACLRRDQFFGVPGVDHVGGRIDVTEDRRDAVPGQRVRGCNERERGNNHLALEAESTHGELETDCPIRHRDAVFDTGRLRDATLELRDQRPAVGEPIPIERTGDPIENGLLVRQVRAADV